MIRPHFPELRTFNIICMCNPLCLTLCNFMNCSSVHGMFQVKYWNGLPFLPPGDRLDPGIESAYLASPALAGGFFTNCTTWEAHLIACVTVCCVLVAQSYLTLCDPMVCSLPGFSVHGILQAGEPEWIATPFSRGSSRSKDWTRVSCIKSINIDLIFGGIALCSHPSPLS